MARAPSRCLASLAAFLLGAGYLFAPIDLIPDRIPFFGHLDEASFLLGGIYAARRLVPVAILERAGVPAARRRPPPWASGLRALAMGGLGAGAPALHRLSLGVWPDREASRRMGAALRDHRTPLPPLMRTLSALPAARTQLSRVLLLDLIRAGALARPPDIGGRAQIPPQSGDPLAFWDGPPIAFLHFEKTAGVALAEQLTRRFHPLQIDQDPDRAAPPHLLSPYPAHMVDRVRRKALLWGHHDLPALRRADPDRAVLTMLREPAARIVSLYEFWRSVDPSLVDRAGGNFQIAMMRGRSLAAFLDSPEPALRNYIDNVYVRRLIGAYVAEDGADPLAADPRAALARALAALDALAVAGVTERMPASLAALRNATGLDLGAALPVANATAHDDDRRRDPGRAGGTDTALVDGAYRPVARTVVDAACRARLARLTRLDRVIYRRACRRLDRGDEAAA